MFHFPKYSSNEPIKVVQRSSRGYEYDVLTFASPCGSEQETFTVLTNLEKTKIFAYTPPRQTVSIESFRESYLDGEMVEVKHAIEGTMLTLFWNDDVNAWELCSRNGVGCDYAFLRPIQHLDASLELFRPRTFRRMVFDALCGNRSTIEDLSEIENLQHLDKTHCYNFILRHHENHLVYEVPLGYAFANLVSIHKFERDTESGDITVTKTNDPVLLENASKVFITSPLKTEYVCSAEYLENMLTTPIASETRILDEDIVNTESIYYPPAWILTNPRTGDTVEVKNPNYERALALRNIQPNLRYQWIDLHKNMKIIDYVEAFPRYYGIFSQFYDEYNHFIGEVYNAYVKFYILKQKEPKLPKKYFFHAARIHHTIYLPSVMSNEREKIHISTVKTYFENMSTSKMFYYLTRSENDENVEKE